MRNEANAFRRLYDGFVRVVSSLQSPFLLVIRLYWGWQFAQTGWGKLHSLPHVTEFFASLGLPAPGFTATFVATFEFVGGILLALGLLSRITALGIVIDMFMAYWTADRASLLSFFSDPGKFSDAAPFIFLFVGLIILIFGPGKLSLDTLIDRTIRKRKYSDSVENSSSLD
jgi:putative oxidoreductase